MSNPNFPGAEQMIAAIDAAVALRDQAATTTALRNSLCKMMREQQLQLPNEVFECCGEHYARRELYRSPDHDYAIVAMTWGPGQGTSIHDHSGVWCVEGVIKGSLEIAQYELREENGDAFRFEHCGTMVAGPGSAGSLIPPHEYHTIKNASNDEPAVSVHVYAKPLTCCAVFEPSPSGWHQKTMKQLALD